MRHAQLEDLVHGLRRGHALHHGKCGLVDQRHQHPIGDESRRVVDLDRRLAQLEGQLADGCERCLAGGQAAHNLHQRHHRHGVEEVHADHLRRTAGFGPQSGDGYGGCVAGQDGASRQDAVERAEDLRLHVETL